MSRKSRHNEKVRARIIGAAADAFRRDGYERTSIDALMAGANLTRGAFYAHFSSKSVLFQAALSEDDLFLRLLRGRSALCDTLLRDGLLNLLKRLLEPKHLTLVAESWSLPTLMRDVALGGEASRAAYEQALAATLDEMARGFQGSDRPRLSAVLIQVCGAVAMASACASERARADLLASARATASHLLETSSDARTNHARDHRSPAARDPVSPS